MPRMRMATTLVGSACLLGSFALSASLQNAAAQTGGDDVPVVTPAQPSTLPNMPEVGDTSPHKSENTKSDGAAADTGVVTPGIPTVLPNMPEVGDTSPSRGRGQSSTNTDGTHPDWPCVQRKVTTLTSAQIWDGPPTEKLTDWKDDEKITETTEVLLSRRVPLEDVEKAIQDYAASLPENVRDEKLTQLFASLLSKTNKDRQFVMSRVEEYQRRQKARSKELEREGIKLAELNQPIPAEEQLGPRDMDLTAEQQEYNWNARIFQERQQNLTVACEIPVLIEQRAFEVGRLIRQNMKE